MIVLAREICRDQSRALAHEWFISNGHDCYASASITGALTRREHGLLVVRHPSHSAPLITLAKVDEEIEVGGQVIKLGTNEYRGDVVSPEGFLYLQQAAFDGIVAKFSFEAGRFQLTKSIWMDPGTRTTYLRYFLTEQSEPVSLTLLPFCDYRSHTDLTQGREDWRFLYQLLENGCTIRATEQALPYRLQVSPNAVFLPLDLWYWRFQLRSAASAHTDLFLPGQFRAELQPGGHITFMATLEDILISDAEVERSLARATARTDTRDLPQSDQFTSQLFQ
jgi:predicted glycogen debranching enzyme